MLNQLRMELHRIKQEEKYLLKAVRRACDNNEEAMIVEFDVDDLSAFVASSTTYLRADCKAQRPQRK